MQFIFKCQYEKMLQGYQILVLVACFPRQCGFCFLLFAVVSEDMFVLNVVVALGLGHTPMHGTTYHKNLHMFLISVELFFSPFKKSWLPGKQVAVNFHQLYP